MQIISSGYKTLHTLKTKSVTLEPEPGFVMVLTVTVPKTKRKKKVPPASGSANTYECTYSPDSVHDNVLVAILTRSYDMFKMFTGGFDRLMKVDGVCADGDDAGIALFKGRVTAFFSKYVHSLSRGLEKADLGSNLFQGVRFQALETQAFLKVHSFVQRISDAFRDIVDNALFFHQEIDYF